MTILRNVFTACLPDHHDRAIRILRTGRGPALVAERDLPVSLQTARGGHSNWTPYAARARSARDNPGTVITKSDQLGHAPAAARNAAGRLVRACSEADEAGRCRVPGRRCGARRASRVDSCAGRGRANQVDGDRSVRVPGRGHAGGPAAVGIAANWPVSEVFRWFPAEFAAKLASMRPGGRGGPRSPRPSSGPVPAGIGAVFRQRGRRGARLRSGSRHAGELRPRAPRHCGTP